MQVKLVVIAVLALLCGCTAIRKGVSTVDNAIGIIGGVKDDAIGAINTLIDVSENVKTNIVKGASSTANEATQ